MVAALPETLPWEEILQLEFHLTASFGTGSKPNLVSYENKSREKCSSRAGVLAMAWCPMDSSLLLTCAKDNVTYCWDTNSGEVAARTPNLIDLHYKRRLAQTLSTCRRYH
jgi:hypothetical protein